jgi:hypothetical protein
MIRLIQNPPQWAEPLVLIGLFLMMLFRLR